MKFRSYALALCVVLSTACATLAQGLPTADPLEVGLAPDRIQRVRDVIARRVEEGKIAGAVMLISRKGKVAYFDTIGMQDREAEKPMTKDTIFRIYSMSKPITSVAVMMLYEEGRFQLNDPVSKYLPELGGLQVGVEMKNPDSGETTFKTVLAEREITIQDLLRHTSGLTYGFFGESAVDKKYTAEGLLRTDKTIAETVEKLGKLPLKHQPGTQFEYSVSTDVLGRLVEVVSGQPFDEFLEQRIFKPLGMTDTAFYVPSEKIDRLAQLYAPQPNGTIVAAAALISRDYAEQPTHFSGGGGLASTAADYTRFCQMMLNGGELNGTRLLGRKTVELMTSDHLGSIPKSPLLRDYGFGLGFAVRPQVGGFATPGSTGDYYWGGAAGTGFWIDPKEELIGVFMVQNWMEHDSSTLFKNLVYQAIVD